MHKNQKHSKLFEIVKNLIYFRFFFELVTTLL